MTSLTIENVYKQFGQTKILQDISLDLADGEFLVLVGPSGCGKSTLMNIVAGLEEPSARCTGLVARLSLPVVTVSTLSFALTLSFSLCLVLLHAEMCFAASVTVVGCLSATGM